MNTIKVLIDLKTGEVVMEGIGFRGEACDAAMGELETALGIQASRIDKPEFHETTDVQPGQFVNGSYPKGRW